MPERARPKILIIDDDHLVRETVRLALKHAGFDVSTIESPEAARLVVRQSQPDAIIMDLYMPEKSGLELCRELKKDEKTKHIPIMIFTGSNETIDVLSGIEAGAFTYVTKPVDGRVLVDKISQMLKKDHG
jgi:DNA-binding response OmpR family regulator